MKELAEIHPAVYDLVDSLKISVKYFGVMKEVVGKKEESFEVEDTPTVLSVLQMLCEKYGEQFRSYVFDQKTGLPRQNLQFTMDGKNCDAMDGLKTRVWDGSVLSIIWVSGG